MTPADARHQNLLDELDAVLFDLDGTLLDTARDLVYALHLICAQEEQPAPALELASRYVSTGAIGLVRLAFGDQDPAREDALRQRLVNVYAQNLCVHTAPYPGIMAVLDELDQREIAWGVVTNKMLYLADPILEHLQLRQRCATLIGGDSAARNKPHPDPIQLALQQLGVAPDKAMYVGDHEKDVLAGRAAGTRTVAVTWGYIVPGEDPYRWGADYTIEEAQQILALGATA
jgi:phosphoglycolate phosphatase